LKKLVEIGFGRRAHGLKPAADINLSVSLSAEMARSICIGRVLIPAKNAKLSISALNHEPVHRVVRDRAADFAPKFLKRGHRYPNCEVPTLVVVKND
jgi:hypothetical protein